MLPWGLIPEAKVAKAPGTSIVVNAPLLSRKPCACGVIIIDPHDVAMGIDRDGDGAVSTGDVDSGERTVAQQKAMGFASLRVGPHDVAFEIDPKGQGSDSTGEVDDL